MSKTSLGDKRFLSTSARGTDPLRSPRRFVGPGRPYGSLDDLSELVGVELLEDRGNIGVAERSARPGLAASSSKPVPSRLRWKSCAGASK
jgi:hypothetical protein